MKSIQLIFGTYNCQPVGKTGNVFEQSYQASFKPFLSALNRFPDFFAVLHYSGILLEWLEKNHPEFMMLLSDMVSRKQVELLTGGFYEPVLPLIPNHDKLGQIEKMTTFLRAHFGRRPRGCWLTERIWDSSLASTLNTSGIEYTFLDNQQFRNAGLEEDELYYPYITEDQGKTISVFPLSEIPKNLIPQGSPEDVLGFILNLADESGQRVVSRMMEGQRLGLTENEHKRMFADGWLERFIALVLEKTGVINPNNQGRNFRLILPHGKVYLPTTSYSDMMGWLSAEKKEGKRPSQGKQRGSRHGLKPCIEGGLFRHFLTQYPESNLMYSKMMYTHLQVNQIRGDKFRKKTARDELWRGQCHAAYWHSEIGGIYTSYLRRQAYRSFIEAETVIRSDTKQFDPSIISFDFDMDGSREFLYQGRELNVYVHSLGGLIFELDHLPSRWNYQDTLARRPEAYHRVKDRIYDWYMRKTFIDHFLGDGDSVKEFKNMRYKELGDFVTGRYELVDMDRDHHRLDLSRNGSVVIRGTVYPVRIVKKYRFMDTVVQVDYTITNEAEKELNLRFGAELNLAFASAAKEDVSFNWYQKNKKFAMSNGMSEHQDVGKVLIQDIPNRVNITLNSLQDFDVWSVPLETVAYYRGVSERIYQSSCFVPHWSFGLGPGASWSNSLSITFSSKGK